MTDVWRNDVERDAFIESNCARCFQPDEAMKRLTGDGPGCPHLARAAKNKMPAAWTKRRNAVMGETYKCSAFTPKPPVNRRAVSDEETPPMFEDLPEVDRTLVPVEGWPDYLAEQRKSKDGDHQ